MSFRNQFVRDGDTAVLQLTQNRVTIIDWSDMILVLQFNWHALNSHGCWYAATNKNGTLYMHQLLLPGPDVVHHIDGDGLNNRRTNLERMTQSEHARLHMLRA